MEFRSRRFMKDPDRVQRMKSPGVNVELGEFIDVHFSDAFVLNPKIRSKQLIIMDMNEEELFNGYFSTFLYRVKENDPLRQRLLRKIWYPKIEEYVSCAPERHIADASIYELMLE